MASRNLEASVIDQSTISLHSVHNLKEELRVLKAVGGNIKPINLLVYAVQRYQVDGNFSAETGLSHDVGSDGYDITLTDGTHLIKCLLAPKLNTYVQKNKLHAGCVVRLLDCKLHYNEMSLKAESYLILEELEYLPIETPHIQNVDQLLFWPGASDLEKSNQPLAVSREYYLPLWNDNDPYGEQWENEVKPVKISSQVIPSITKISKVVERWQRGHLHKPHPPILGRILSVARLHYYGKADRFREKWPYQVYLDIADSSGCLPTVLWTRLAPKYFNSLTVGNVLLVENYEVKRRYSLHSKTVLHNPDVNFLDAELSLNSSHPEAVIKIIQPSNTLNHFDLPTVKYKFLTRKQLSGAPDQLICDVCGIVTFVGRWHRTRNVRKGPQSDSFWCSRWLHIVDHSSDKPIILEIFSTSQPSVHSQLMPGMLLVCNQMKVINQVGDNSRSQRHVYLTSTNKSRLYSNNHVHNAYKDEFIIGVLQSWSNSEAIRRLLDVSIIGGYYGYPPLTSSLEDFQTQFSADGVFKLLPMEGLKSELDHLQYREHKRVVIQGHVAAIKVVHRSKHTDSSVIAATQQLGDSQAQSQSDTMLVGGISSPVQTRASRKQEQTKYTVEKVLRNRRVKVMITAPKKRQQDGSKMMDKKQKTASDQNDKDVEGSQDNNESSTTSHPQQDLSYDVDPQWCVLEQKIPIIGSHRICQQTLPRIYSQKYSDVLQYSFGLQPSVVANTMPKETLEDVPVSETLQDYYHVTLVGLNRTAAVNTVFIPDISMTSNRESLNTDKMSFLTLLTGTKTTEMGGSVESDPPTDTGPQTQHQQTTNTGNAAVVHGRTAPNEGVEHDLDSLRGVRLVAVLDLYCCGDGQTEIILNRAYTV